jgi:hypothetical protein
MMIGSYFFLLKKTDWAYTGVYDMFYQQALQKIAKKQNFDLEKVEALRNYVTHMEKGC